MLEIIEFKSLNPGKSILITAAVHGNEVCGSIASKNIISKIQSGEIKLKNGSITFIPICNPEANKRNTRFFEVNLNRVIKKKRKPILYEEKIANILTDYIKANDYHLDIHSMHENGRPFAFQDHDEQEEFVKILGLEYIYVNWPSIYDGRQKVKDYSTQYYSHLVNTISTTIECGAHTDKKAIDVAEKCILRALTYLDIIECENILSNVKQNFIDMKKVCFKEYEGKFTKNYNELYKVKKGETIAIYDNGKEIKAEEDYLIIFPNKKAKIGEEWFYFGKELKK